MTERDDNACPVIVRHVILSTGERIPLYCEKEMKGHGGFHYHRWITDDEVEKLERERRR